MTIDEAIKQLEYGIEQMTMELKSGLWETGSDTEAEVKQGVKYNQQLIDWLTELKEAKRLLKSATNVLNMFKPCDNDYNCNECINQRQNCDYDDRFKWRYADEALKLIEEDGEYDEKTI
jgi:hypothetical protein